LGQTEKHSVRANVFRFALELGHCSTQSALSNVPGPDHILTVVDDCTRECLTLVAETSLSGARELDRLMIERGKPKMVVSDNGSELTSNTDPDMG
jgi:transposase InsO family protein